MKKFDLEQFVRTADKIRETAIKYLDMNNYVQVILLPEKKE